MRVTILAFGTRGDVQPLIAFGLGLQAAGHTVRFVTPHAFYELAHEYDLDCVPVELDLRLPSQKQVKTGRLSAFRLAKLAQKYIRDALGNIWEATQDSEALVFSDWGRILGTHLIEKLGVPACMGLVHPQQMRIIYPETNVFGTHLGWLQSWARKWLLWHLALRKPINEWRRDTLELPATTFFSSELALKHRRIPLFYEHSAYVFPKPTNWPNWLHVTGYWFLDVANNWHPPKDLVKFLAAGTPPICIGFSSMSNQKVSGMAKVIIQALSLAQQRGILLAGWSELGKNITLPEDVFCIDAIPHTWLFPQVAAVVHHGGPGTLAVALRAGVPNIVVPFALDQPFWGERVAQLGVGPAPISPDELTAEKLAAAIDKAVNDKRIKQRAATLGAKIRAEDGVNRAVELFDQYVEAANT